MQRVITRSTVALACSVALALTLGSPALAESDCSVGAGAAPGRMNSSVVVQGECDPDPRPTPDSRPTTVGVAEEDAEPEPVWALEPVWGVHGETGEPCVDLVTSSQVTVNEPLGLLWEARMLEMLHDPRLSGVEFRWCSASWQSVVADPSPIARGFVRSIQLPAPELWVAPGWALTGMDAYLEIGAQEGFVVASPIEGFGSLEVSLQPSRMEVDWGDGTVDQVDDGRLGAPFDGPADEQISHVYLDADAASQVTVDVRWEAAWQVAGFSGVVDDLQISATLDLPVETRRAVRTTPDHAP